MLTNFAIACMGAFVFLRIVAREKNRRERHLIARVEEFKRLLAEQEEQRTVKQAAEKMAEASDVPVLHENEPNRPAAAA